MKITKIISAIMAVLITGASMNYLTDTSVDTAAYTVSAASSSVEIKDGARLFLTMKPGEVKEIVPGEIIVFGDNNYIKNIEIDAVSLDKNLVILDKKVVTKTGSFQDGIRYSDPNGGKGELVYKDGISYSLNLKIKVADNAPKSGLRIQVTVKKATDVNGKNIMDELPWTEFIQKVYVMDPNAVTTTATTTKKATTTTKKATTTTKKATTTTKKAVTTVTTTAKPSTKAKLGDPTGDGKIDSIDASNVLAAYSKFSTKNVTPSKNELAVSDVNGDGYINSLDASKILAYYAYVSGKETMSFEQFLKS
ncbi:dockerin type I domain-containing protein [Ruminococcus flavefaciens]|uniref:dockerin type I domain-containing protein n=1 Tax=Ruminococcus flavefaciens TaxID=1265 RepID=UPI0026ED91D8|nr:dockerin type I domain-containing protein [Ruminococcus flavefaciens]MDD7515313.1 dockerin type I domain-containing protein [Ruminococcus flavefaciens]MDY5692588.1 dockerin type I domain-containing protein [Ruminococcus flavefaciens]